MSTGTHWQPFLDGLAAFVRRRVPERDAEDVAQEVLVRLHQNAHTLQDETRAEAWVYGVARHTIADYYRARERDPVAGAAEPPDEVADPEPVRRKGFGSFEGSHDVHDEVLSWLRPMAEELPEPYRQALLAADFDKTPQRELADRLGISFSGAKSRVQRARGMLGERLRECCEIELGDDGRVSDFRRRRCEC